MLNVCFLKDSLAVAVAGGAAQLGRELKRLRMELADEEEAPEGSGRRNGEAKVLLDYGLLLQAGEGLEGIKKLRWETERLSTNVDDTVSALTVRRMRNKAGEGRGFGKLSLFSAYGRNFAK